MSSVVAKAAPSLKPPLESTAAIRSVEDSVAQVIRGKRKAIRLALAALLARGHLLIEDIPGVGKTTLARAIAASVGGTFRRIQFTSDLLPSDIVGVSVYRPTDHSFEFRPGPLFANIVLADEINRTTPRTQSALLEAMSDGVVSVDDRTHTLEDPFFVVATQNPVEHFGTYPLPESQMDRFLLRIRLGYPDTTHERDIIRHRTSVDPVSQLSPAISHEELKAIQQSVELVPVDDAILDYAMEIVEHTRSSPEIAVGVSTRGALGWYRAAQAHAIIDGRNYCIPDDFKSLAVPALAHRITLASTHDTLGSAREDAERIIETLISRVEVP